MGTSGVIRFVDTNSVAPVRPSGTTPGLYGTITASLPFVWDILGEMSLSFSYPIMQASNQIRGSMKLTRPKADRGSGERSILEVRNSVVCQPFTPIAFEFGEGRTTCRGTFQTPAAISLPLHWTTPRALLPMCTP
jgi:hypothetical protein